MSTIEEFVVVKPSIEKIPDEYEHFKNEFNQKIHVHIFSASGEVHQRKVERIKQCLGDEGFEFNEHNLDTDNCTDVLENLPSNCEKASGLIIFFTGHSYNEKKIFMFNGRYKDQFEIRQIWNAFYTNNCEELKNKPKIFIFEISISKPVQTDATGIRGRSFSAPYDPPNEADILVLYHSSEGTNDFIENLCDNIEMHGKSEDITTLATCADYKFNFPILISTLTRKFYFAPSEHRGYHYKIAEGKKKLNAEIESVKMLINSRNQ